jgi:sugar/nucleoside kinase (ribokinase family)
VSSGPCLGGSGAILSLALARFGNAVTWLGHVGPDGEELLGPLLAAGVERVPLRSEATLRFENRYPDPTRLEYRVQRAFRIPPSFTLPEIERAFAGCRFDLLALGPLTPEEIPVDVLAVLSRLGAPIAVDLQGYVRRVEAGGDVAAAPWPRGRAFPPGIRVVHVDEAEARLVLEGLEKSSAELAALPRALGAALVCVTRGSRGALLYPAARGSEAPIIIPGFRPGPPAAAPVGDATGCGDIFLAGMVHGELRGWSHERSGRFAAVAAGMNAACLHLRVPAAAEVKEFVDDAPLADNSA